ncbi:MAG TPA: mechanosensitive ion channel family protein, partial [Rhodocyclaceae bacterium]|nr:mechanosensitive ion channel family protein [Rhodocyclaceae bacterium]
LPVSPPRILEDIVVMIGYLAWGMALLSRTGLELSSIVTTSAVITAVIAFAMQDTLGNILGGLALQLDSSIEIGDWVKIDDVSGQVIDIRWRYTAIRTRNGENVVIPNSQLMKGKVWLMGDRDRGAPNWRRWVHFNIGYEAPPTRVIAAIEQTLRAAAIANVAKEPAPNCVLMEFGPGYGHYAVRYWLSNPALDDPTDSAVRTHVFAAIQRAGWRLALPEETHYLVKENNAYHAEIRHRELQRRMDALRNIPLFADLSDDERHQLAAHMVHAPFANGDVLTRQGAVAHWLYIITSGECEVVRERPQGSNQRLGLLHAGDVFGEMGL